MTPERFQDARQLLGLTAEQLDALLGVEPRTVRRYEDGSRRIPNTVVRLIRVITEFAEVKRLLELNHSLAAEGTKPTRRQED